MPTPSAADVSQEVNAAHESRAVHPCEALKRNGQICGRYVATVFFNGLFRCPSHRPRRLKDATSGTAPKPPRPPITSLKEPSDAVRLSSWAAVQGALGRL